MAGFFDDGPEPPSRFNPFNPFADEIAILRNGYMLGRIVVIPFLLAMYLVYVVVLLLIKLIDITLWALIRRWVGGHPQKQVLMRRSKGCVPVERPTDD